MTLSVLLGYANRHVCVSMCVCVCVCVFVCVYTQLTETGVVGKHVLYPQAVLQVVATTVTVTPQRHGHAVVGDVVRGHEGAWRETRLNLRSN